MVTMTLEKLLQSQGFGSRKQCRNLILAQRVHVGSDEQSQLCDTPGTEFDVVDLQFSINGVMHRYHQQVYLALNKPAGYECSHQPQNHPSVFSLLPPELIARGTQAVGRLDFDTTGLLLLSDDGTFIHRCSAPKHKLAKVYRVTTKHPISPEQISQLLAGVQLHDAPQPVLAADCQQIAERILDLTICEGKYHQVKRMLAAVGNRVEQLHRHRIGAYELDPELAAGDWHWLNTQELALISNSLFI